MKVIHNVHRREKWKRRVVCGAPDPGSGFTMGCGSTLEIEFSDLTFVADSRDGNAYTFKCPVCGHETWLDASLVPS